MRRVALPHRAADLRGRSELARVPAPWPPRAVCTGPPVPTRRRRQAAGEGARVVSSRLEPTFRENRRSRRRALPFSVVRRCVLLPWRAPMHSGVLRRPLMFSNVFNCTPPFSDVLYRALMCSGVLQCVQTCPAVLRRGRCWCVWRRPRTGPPTAAATESRMWEAIVRAD